MGLFDGVKDAFSAPALERTTIDAERETPIDRWMGWSVAKENKSDESESMAARAGTNMLCALCMSISRAHLALSVSCSI